MTASPEHGLVKTIRSFINTYVPPFLWDDLIYRELAEAPIKMDADFPSRMSVWEVSPLASLIASISNMDICEKASEWENHAADYRASGLQSKISGEYHGCFQRSC